MATTAVITRTKDRPLLLNRSIQSVLNQTESDWQHVIVNDGGDRKILEGVLEPYLSRYRDRLQVIHLEVSGGMEAASNLGIQSCDSKFVAIHDDDDSWHADYLHSQIRCLEMRPDKLGRGVVCKSIKVNEWIHDGKVHILTKQSYGQDFDEINLPKMLLQNSFPPIAFLYERSIHEKIGFFREDLPVLGDWEFNIRFLFAANILVNERALAFYHHRIFDSQSIYGNTVVAGIRKHAYYRSYLVNEFSRQSNEALSHVSGYMAFELAAYAKSKLGIRSIISRYFNFLKLQLAFIRARAFGS